MQPEHLPAPRVRPRAGTTAGWLAALLALALVTPRPATAAEGTTFDALAAGASRSDLGFELEALVMRCDDETDELQHRVCEEVLRSRQARARQQSILVAIDPPQIALRGKRGWRMTLTGCLVCAEPPVLAGKARLLTAAEPLPPKGPAKGGAAKGEPAPAAAVHFAPLGEVMIADPGEPERPAVLAAFGRLRTEAIVKLRAPKVWTVGEKSGIAIETVAWRVVDPCTGKVYLSQPPSAVQIPQTEDPACKAEKKPAPPPVVAPTLPDRLTAADVERAFAPVRTHARQCFQRFRVRGRIDLGLDVRPDGSVKMVRSSGPLVDTPSAECVRAAALRVRFPAFRSHTSMHITYPVLLR